jgi:hypothetical protein
VLTTHAGTIRYAREADSLLFSRQAKQSRTSNRVMRFPQLPSFTFFAEIKFSVGTVAFVIAYLILTQWLLPKIGVPT